MFARLALMWLYAWGVPSEKEKMMTKTHHIRTKLDGKEVMVISGSNNYRIGRVVRNGAFMARGRLTLTIRTREGEYLFATPSRFGRLNRSSKRTSKWSLRRERPEICENAASR